MYSDFSPNQPVRLKPETVQALKKFRRAEKARTGESLSVNGAINAAIVAGEKSAQLLEVIKFWYEDGRFIAENTPEHIAAVKMLEDAIGVKS